MQPNDREHVPVSRGNRAPIAATVRDPGLREHSLPSGEPPPEPSTAAAREGSGAAPAPAQAAPTPAASGSVELAESASPERMEGELGSALRVAKLGRIGARRASQSKLSSRPQEMPVRDRAVVPSITDELALLTRARRIVASDPARALELTAEHGQRYHEGVFAQEREALAIDALLRLGQRELARARARRFVKNHPSSAHAVRLSKMLEGGP